MTHRVGSLEGQLYHGRGLPLCRRNRSVACSVISFRDSNQSVSQKGSLSSMRSALENIIKTQQCCTGGSELEPHLCRLKPTPAGKPRRQRTLRVTALWTSLPPTKTNSVSALESGVIPSAAGQAITPTADTGLSTPRAAITFRNSSTTPGARRLSDWIGIFSISNFTSGPEQSQWENRYE